MPLKRGSSQKTISGNIAEFHTGKTYAKTKAKYGKKTADKQAVAAALSLAGALSGGSHAGALGRQGGGRKKGRL